MKGGENMTIEMATMIYEQVGVAVVVNDGNKITLEKDEK